LEKGSPSWTGKVRGSLVRLDDQDGAFLSEKLTAQVDGGKSYPPSEQDGHKLATRSVNRPDKVVTVSVPVGLRHWKSWLALMACRWATRATDAPGSKLS
jgi:hypothetical protein